MRTPAIQATDAEPRRAGGAPLGNTNRSRHGLRGSNLPKGCGGILRATHHFRRQLEDAVMDARQEVTLVDSAHINTAYRAERHAQLAQRWLAKEADAMTPSDRLAYSREVVKASAERDKAIAALQLPVRPSLDPWSALVSRENAQQPASRDAAGTSVQVAIRTDNASTGVVGDDRA